MSIWMHAKGFIMYQNLTRAQIVEKLGFPVSYNDIRLGVDEDNPIPCGSEGCLQYTIDEDVCEIRFHGSLRDYFDYNEILSWVQRLSDINENDGFDDCIHHAEVELSIGEPPHQFVYDGFATNGEWWTEYRVIPQKEYEELTRSRGEER